MVKLQWVRHAENEGVAESKKDRIWRVYSHMEEQVGLLVLYVDRLVEKPPSVSKCYMV
jgi:hypothetical protein